ncbi:peroxisomal membrane protein pex14 [Elasticomyces elasticus]|nr:peroxisomal membrane protein pex14 [Elasticomyces elasticus]KAK3633717.1 peroxisomal membrane protein pex14 [Elasticomyces elasticus]KAK4914516.1 peroxisomal membrane protein pex14 [Elasticomyces elasticus]KAK5754341.1 peroxisomal membrane protein pex14 [Elasticomyces elasticus]
MVREDLIEGAITFLQDPSVSSAPVEQKIAFLRSKNLTQDEIDTSLARIGQPQQQPTSQPSPNYPQQQQQYRAPHQYPQQQQGYNNTGYPPQWTSPPPPMRRDWRDYFVAATLLTTLGYGIYWTANRYISPLISPPTPTQLQSDKDAVTESFDKAFALLDQLATDTTELKAAESARTERLDKALAEVEGVIREMREANEDRVREGRALAKEVEGVREAIPKALEREKGRWEGKLEEVGTEMRSLKTLIQGRMQAPASGPVVGGRTSYGQAPAVNGTGSGGVAGSGAGTFAPATAPGLNLHAVPKPETNDGGSGSAFTPTPSTPSLPTSTTTSLPQQATTNGDSAAAAVLPTSSTSNTSPYGRKLGGKAQIPSWQLGAKKRTEDAAAAAKTGTTSDAGTGTDSGTATPVEGSAKVEAKPAEVSEEVVAEA